MPNLPLRPRTMLILASVLGLANFGAFLEWETPGLGIGHFYYVAIIVAALGTGPVIGAAAGASATALYVLGVLLNPAVPSSQVRETSTGIRFATFVAVGLVTGYVVERNRRLVRELEVLADRDSLTGLPNTRAFERAVTERLRREQPFALLVGDVDSFQRANQQHGHLHGDDVLREVAARLSHLLQPGDEVARVGGDEFAVLTHARTTGDAARVAATLQRVLADDGFAVTFGWAAYPQDGSNALSLYRAADERLYARRVIHGERPRNLVPVPAAAADTATSDTA
jgi:diguanylate cyclase (GGDEF)-like protein